MEPGEKNRPGKTWLDLVAEEAARVGRKLDPGEADWILWEETPFPLAGIDEVRAALRVFFGGGDKAA